MVLNLIRTYNLDILCLTETWFNSDCEYCTPPGYKMYRCDRGSRGGGVAIITRSDYKVSIIDKSEIVLLEKTCLEYLLLKVQTSHRRSIVFGVIYKPRV